MTQPSPSPAPAPPRRVVRFRLFRPLTDRIPCLRGGNGLSYSVRLPPPPRYINARHCAYTAMGLAMDCFVLCLGPVLICLASLIIAMLTMSFFNVLLPMLAPDGPRSATWLCHAAFVAFVLTNVLFNYVMCVCTRNGGEKYQRVVRELARATGYNYPEGPEEVERARIDYEQLLLQRRRHRQLNHLRQAEGGVANERQSQSPADDVAAAAGPPPPSRAMPAASGLVSSSDRSAGDGGGGGAAATDEEASPLLLAPLHGDDGAEGPAAPEEIVLLDRNGSNGEGGRGAATANNRQRRHARDDRGDSSPLEVGGGGGGNGGGGGGGGSAKRRQPNHHPRRPVAAAPSHLEGQGVVHAWTLLRAHEWGFCNRSNQPKPPRSHYDHVTGTLVLNMDHYCPWMFNTVGYFNYRYFCNFLLYVFVGTSYGFIITYTPFRNLDSAAYRQQVQMSRDRGFKTVQHLLPYVPTPTERMSVAFSFMLCLSVGVAVFCLMSFHAYLIFSAQTTIEFHANWPKRRRARRRGRVAINPYDLGPRRNWQQVYGMSPVILALMPSFREPEFLPVPLAGEKGRRLAVDTSPASLGVNGSERTDLRDKEGPIPV